jgi:chromate reductase, NAD(P)H dehydrogenase (quinone)
MSKAVSAVTPERCEQSPWLQALLERDQFCAGLTAGRNQREYHGASTSNSHHDKQLKMPVRQERRASGNCFRVLSGDNMIKIVGIAGSVRAASLNASLLRAAAGLMPDGAELEIAGIKGIPLYDGDVEANEGIPASVAMLKDRIAAAHGLLLVTPEYNNGIPGVFKNAVDWLSRPPADIPRVFNGRPVAVIGATTGGFGTVLAQQAWLPVLRTLGTRPWFGARLQVARAGSVFNDAGDMVDEKVKEQLRQFNRGFVEFVRASVPA